MAVGATFNGGPVTLTEVNWSTNGIDLNLAGDASGAVVVERWRSEESGMLYSACGRGATVSAPVTFRGGYLNNFYRPDHVVIYH